MKKTLIIFIAMIMLFAGFGCAKNGTILKAKIIETGEGVYLVEPVPGSPELNSADRISIPIKNMDTPREPQNGDILEISYDGSILESYPAGLGEIYSIKLAE